MESKANQKYIIIQPTAANQMTQEAAGYQTRIERYVRHDNVTGDNV
jgi:hypothetical protein